MIRAVVLALVLDLLVMVGFVSYTAGLVEGVTPRHRSDSSASISR